MLNHGIIKADASWHNCNHQIQASEDFVVLAREFPSIDIASTRYWDTFCIFVGSQLLFASDCLNC